MSLRPQFYLFSLRDLKRRLRSRSAALIMRARRDAKTLLHLDEIDEGLLEPIMQEFERVLTAGTTAAAEEDASHVVYLLASMQKRFEPLPYDGYWKSEAYHELAGHITEHRGGMTYLAMFAMISAIGLKLEEDEPSSGSPYYGYATLKDARLALGEADVTTELPADLAQLLEEVVKPVLKDAVARKLDILVYAN